MNDMIITVKFGDGRANWSVVRPGVGITYEDPSGSGSTIRRGAEGGIDATLKIPGSHLEWAMNTAAGWQP